MSDVPVPPESDPDADPQGDTSGYPSQDTPSAVESSEESETTVKRGRGRPTGSKTRGARESKHSPRRMESVETQRQALEYRLMGLTYQQIAEKLEITDSGAHYSVEAALRRTLQEPADELRQLELRRLDAMFIPVYGNAVRGDLAAITAAINIMNRRARLVGLDAPEKRENTNLNPPISGLLMVPSDISAEDWEKAVSARQAALVAGSSTTDSAKTVDRESIAEIPRG
jgi:hypothetical protein